MRTDCLKLTTYFGERDRADGGFLADALVDLYERRGFRTGLVMRGVEGFGAKHRLQTARLLTLSEDLPLVSVAVDERRRIEAALGEVVTLAGHGLVTLERARLMTGGLADPELPDRPGQAVKLTLYVGRRQRVPGGVAHLEIVDLLRRCEVDGATVLLGVDGVAQGERRRGRFFSGNSGVPLMIISVGSREAIGEAVRRLDRLLEEPVLTVEQVRVCKRDGRRLAEPPRLPRADGSGLSLWQKLMVFSGEQSRHHGRPLAPELVRALRAEGAAGATTLRGVWGYHGDHGPHGDSLLAIRRRVPVVTVIVDTPARIREWFAIVDRFTDETGLVTSETVPAFRATGPGIEVGGLQLATPERPDQDSNLGPTP